jgi:oligosaccharyltransferase complex subunit gamma
MTSLLIDSLNNLVWNNRLLLVFVSEKIVKKIVKNSKLIYKLDGSLSFVLGALIISVPKLDDVGRQRAGVYIWMACFIFIFSCLLVLFKIKNGAYPFKLLL